MSIQQYIVFFPPFLCKRKAKNWNSDYYVYSWHWVSEFPIVPWSYLPYVSWISTSWTCKVLLTLWFLSREPETSSRHLTEWQHHWGTTSGEPSNKQTSQPHPKFLLLCGFVVHDELFFGIQNTAILSTLLFFSFLKVQNEYSRFSLKIFFAKAWFLVGREHGRC